MGQTREIFDSAVEIPDQTEREAMLTRACKGNPELRARVDELLAAHTEAEQFFSNYPLPLPALADGALTKIFPAGERDLAGSRIGHFKLLQKIGEGGCGVVYMAGQEKPVRRRVALKIIKLGMDTKSVIVRFESERQALAMMDHPNIARVFDAGATETGRPFFVMELIHGIGILEYCDKNHLDTRRRLGLFVQVCNAIQHAHQKGIVHRDIKPSNILVTLNDGIPVPKVIDFGIAKAIADQLTDKTLFTVYGCFIGTPAYMSPEQAEFSEMDVDTRSDIYSLGVLLYELLTGKTPFDQKDLMAYGLDEMRRTLREREPHRPSTRLKTMTAAELTATALHRHIETPKLQLMLKGDLDWIVMKALEKDRKRRYETANGLGMDISRFLNNEPILARPPSRWYRFKKLAQRNRVVFAAAGAVTLALLIGLGASTWLLVKEREMRHRAVAAEQRAELSQRNEMQLRREAEARADIARAAVMLSRGRLAEAEQLVDQLQVPVIEPSLEAVGVFRTLGDWAANDGRWAQAVAHFKRLNLADQVDKTEVTDSSAFDLLRLGPTLIAAGDLAGYHEFVKKSIARFSSVTNLIAAEQAIKVSLICPADSTDILALEPLAKVLTQSLDEAKLASPGDQYMIAWREFALSLYEYRRGDFTDSIMWQKRCLASSNFLPERVAMAHFVLAMALHQTQQTNAAQSELNQGQELIHQKCPDAVGKISISNMPPGSTVYWYDWAIAQILQHEAVDLIKPAAN